MRERNCDDAGLTIEERLRERQNLNKGTPNRIA